MKVLLISSVMALLVLLPLVNGAFAKPSAVQVPLQGSLEAQETYVPDPDNGRMFATSEGSGNSTQLGKYTIHYSVTVYFATLQGVGASAEITAANGDKLFAEGSGQATPTGADNTFSIVETYTITGGTGRFENAAGSFTVNRTVSTATGVTSGSFVGSVSAGQ